MSAQTLSLQPPPHPLWTATRWLGILFTCVLTGAVAGAVAYMPLHVPAWIAATVAVLAALLYAGLWGWQQRAARRSPNRRARRWGWGLALAPWIVIGATLALALFQLYSLGQFPPLTQDRVAHFDRLARALDRAYPYFDEKGIDWQTRVAAIRPQIETAQTDAAYFALLATLLAGLDDGHTSLTRPVVPFTWFGQLAEIEGQAVVVSTHPSAEAAGLAVGDVVVALDGQEVDAAIASLPPQLRYGSTAWNRREFALSHLLTLRGPAQSLDVTVRRADGGVHTVTLTPPPAPIAAAGPSAPLVQGRRLPSDIGYIHLGQNFADRPGHDMLAEFDAALAALMDTPGLILDLRDNGGGSSLIAGRIAGRFLAEPFTYGREVYRQRLPMRVWWLWSERSVTPRPPLYTAPLLLLVDATTVSSAEESVIALVDSGRGQTVGRQTGGSTGNPIVFQLPGGGRARFSTGDLRRSDGAPIEGVGIRPDLPVAWTLEDVRQGRDPDLAAAVQWLGE